MRKLQAFLRGLMLVATLCIVVVTVTLYIICNAIIRRSYADMSREELLGSVRMGQELLSEYREGKIDLAQLHEEINPRFRHDDVFFLLTDENGTVLDRTDHAVSYLNEERLAQLVKQLETADTVFDGQPETGDTCFLMAARHAQGMVIAGKPMLPYDSAVRGFRATLITYMVPVMLVMLGITMALSMYMGRPANEIVNAVQRLSEGEDVHVSESLPMEMDKAGRAFNRIARTMRKAKGDLKYERNTFALVLAGLNEGVIAVSEDGAVLHENKAAIKLLGGRESKSYAQLHAELFRSLEERTPALRLKVGDATLLAVFSPLPVREEGKRGAIAMIRDITEQERLEITRRDYVANISHELRTPLASMRGIAEGLRDGLVEEKDKQRYYEMIVTEVHRLSRLVNDLLELSHLQASSSAFEMEKVDPAETLYELMDRTERLAGEKGLEMKMELPEKAVKVKTNEDRLQQVLTILLDNAIKYTPAGGNVTLGARNVPEGVRFFVRDSGVGMDEYTVRHAFERFYQADPSHGAKGSGLGLSIAKEILQKMNIKIRVDSEPGKGSEFYFTVPVWEA
ncbi:MAG: hypothetical protein IKW00_00805 [Clostridia bacterium]|nr:hypothetical protein [Clostridia bacterium]